MKDIVIKKVKKSEKKNYIPGNGSRCNIDLDKLKKYMALRPSLSRTAAFFDCSNRTIEDFIKAKHPGMTFRAFRELHLDVTRNELVSTAIERALQGSDKLLMYLLDRFVYNDKDPVVASVAGQKLVVMMGQKKKAD